MNVQNDDGDARRVALINEEIRRCEPEIGRASCRERV
jgi:hypothetical protein